MLWPEVFLFRPLCIIITGFVFLHAHGQPFNIWPEVFLACCVFTTGFFLNVQGQPFNTYLLRLQLKAHCTTKALHCSSKNISRYIIRRRLVQSCNSKRSFSSMRPRLPRVPRAQPGFNVRATLPTNATSDNAATDHLYQRQSTYHTTVFL